MDDIADLLIAYWKNITTNYPSPIEASASVVLSRPVHQAINDYDTLRLISTSHDPSFIETPSSDTSLRPVDKDISASDTFKGKASSRFEFEEMKNTLPELSESGGSESERQWRPSISPDASNLMIWSHDRIYRRSLRTSDAYWERRQSPHKILLAAVSRTHFAVVMLINGDYRLAINEWSAFQGFSSTMKVLGKPTALCFSYDGSRLALATTFTLTIFYPPPTQSTHSDTHRIVWTLRENTVSESQLEEKSVTDAACTAPQKLCFTPSGARVLVETQFDDMISVSIIEVPASAQEPSQLGSSAYRWSIKVASLESRTINVWC